MRRARLLAPPDAPPAIRNSTLAPALAVAGLLATAARERQRAVLDRLVHGAEKGVEVACGAQKAARGRGGGGDPGLGRV